MNRASLRQETKRLPAIERQAAGFISEVMNGFTL